MSSVGEVEAARALTCLSLPMAQTKLTIAVQNEIRRFPSPLIYVGVTLQRPPNDRGGGWGLSLFHMSNNLVVGGVRQHIVQGLTSWAWATTVPPRRGVDFRSSFGPLFPTSLLQLMPGDVILSINGESYIHEQQHQQSIWNAPHLDIVAVRLESARQAAHQVLCSNVQSAEYRAAQVAFETMRPWLHHPSRSLMVPPQVCQQHNLFLTQRSAQDVMARSARKAQEKQSGESQASQVLPPITAFPEWVAARKAMWKHCRQTRKRARDDNEQTQHSMGSRLQLENQQPETKWLQTTTNQLKSDRAKRQRLDVDAVQQSSQEPLVFVSFKLERQSLATPWGIHVSHYGGRFLGVGHVSEAVAGSTRWMWATTSPIPGYLLTVQDELVVRSHFQTQTLHSSTFPYLQAGDFIISVSGRPVSSFASLEDVASFMKQSMSLIIVAIRHREPSELAQRARFEGKAATEICSTAFRRFNQILHQLSTTNTLSNLWQQCDSVQRRESFAATVVVYRNPLFRDDKGAPVLFESVHDPEDGSRASQFLPPIPSESFPSWLKQRKATWRENWNTRVVMDSDDDDEPSDRGELCVAIDFWTPQGYASFGQWLEASTSKWKQSYSWNRKKRERVARVCEQVVHYPQYEHRRADDAIEQAHRWLSVRKQQWRFLRRKRQRRWENQTGGPLVVPDNCSRKEVDEDVKPDCSITAPPNGAARHMDFPASSPRSVIPRQTSEDMTIIDALLEEQEREEKVLKERPPLDIRFLFDARIGAPDDVVAHCLEFLPRSDHGKLLCVSAETSAALKERGDVWQQLCPSHWVLPRRPRKQWHELYITRIREEVKESRKCADEILNKAHDILLHADHLNKIEKLVRQGEKRADFNINYTSGVVCERNSLLNLAVIYSRTKVARWLVESKGADIETIDRGGFTPLLNAAYGGDRSLVRLLLNHGADRSKIGYCHFFEPLAPPEFKGLNAAGWARRRGHPGLSELITLGL